MGLFDKLFGETVEIEFVDNKGQKRTKRVSKREFDALMEKAIAEGKATPLKTCKAHILHPVHGLQIENWVIGEQISAESYEKFKDESGGIYIGVAYENGVPTSMIMEKGIWMQMAAEFEDLDDGVAAAREEARRLLRGDS